ncbi:MAG: DUF4174 domain-containing protein [Deltaproteobacteria bacterium]|nr:MAG: DUF4174 domain-containing protein [Deltaproteobacteria bacterium]
MASKVEGKNSIDLSEYQWKNRLLLLFTPSLDEPRYLKLKEDISSQEEEVKDRDLLVFHILESGETKLENSPLPESSGDYLREKFSITPGAFTVLLIGKDGGVKLRSEGGVELAEIFALIDTMPMRQREMREKPPQR